MKKVVLITGVSKGLGKTIAEKFRSEGFSVSGVSRSEPDFDLDLFIKGDITEEPLRKRVINETIDRYGRLDILINNAGIGLYDSWEDSYIADIKKLFELNFFSVVDFTKKSLPYLKESKGCVINISSVAGKLYLPYMGAYCSSKFALNAFSDSLRAELKPYKVHILNLIVGRINTGFSDRALGKKKPPETPFSGSAKEFAEVVYKGYINRKKEVWYPYWYRFFVVLAKLFPDVYEKISLKKWE